MGKKHVEEPEKIEPVWGPSVPHTWSCRDGMDANGRCTCPKSRYCAACDAQHNNGHCPRSVLDDMRDAIFYKDELNHDRLVSEILASAEARARASYGAGQDGYIKDRINELAERHGNLGITRKKLFNLVKKEQKRRWRRSTRRRTPKRWRR